MEIRRRDRQPLSVRAGLLLIGAWLASAASAEGQKPPDVIDRFWAAGVHAAWFEQDLADPSPVLHTSLLQPQPALAPSPEVLPQTPLPQSAATLGARLFGAGTVSPSLVGLQWRPTVPPPGTDVVLGGESKARVTTDAGSLLDKSPSVQGVDVQRRTPIVHDPRVRASRVGQLAASGSYWVPARIDLDTELSKIDSRIVADMIVIKGPYSVLYGPGIDFIDVELLRTPRYANGFEAHGSTSFDYKVNGEQWYGRQSLWGGSHHWGYRVGYGHRTGNDYISGSGVRIPSSYKSRNIDVALGAEPSDDSSVLVNYLRLDQTDVEFPGYAFDIDYLVTDGLDVEYVLDNGGLIDRLRLDGWYNRTRFEGSAQRPGKRRLFPFFDFIEYEGFTDVDSTSTGFRLAASWGEDVEKQLTAGVDLRHIRQELNEISSGEILFQTFEDVNSPVPRSRWTNPGLFLEKPIPVTDRLSLAPGVRVDWLVTDVIDDPQKLSELGILQVPLADILGTDEFSQHFTTWAVYVNGEYELNPCWKVLAAAGEGQRPPWLTELYAAQPFMFLLQNGQNTVTGDPRLKPERAWQVDLGLAWDYPRLRGGVTGFHTWIADYITFENIGVFPGPARPEQVNLKYVNTELATLVGIELHCEYDWKPWLTPFATVHYIDGRDRTRDGEFATRPVSSTQPSERVPGLPRGYFSGIAGAPAEALPSLPPLKGRVGARVHPCCCQPDWSVEISARIVNRQDRVATSLLETPTPGYTVWDLRSYWQTTENFLLIFGVENFTNRNYREHLDFRGPSGTEVLQPGISCYFGAERTY